MKTAIRALTLAAALSAATALTAPVALAQEAPAIATVPAKGPLLNLSAYGEVRAAPDMATINLGVSVQAPTAAEAMKQNAARMNGLIAALKRQGVAEKDIQTSGLSLSPQYAYEQNQAPKLTGYQANNTVTVTVFDLARLGQTIDATVGAGGNEISGISFGLRDPQAAEDAARVQAVKRLQAKAGLYAGAVGKRIVALKSLSESGGYTPEPPRPLLRMAAMKAESTPVAAGELTLRIDVQGTYELEP
ncbi:MAG: SIMPL domain-containing protein [Proteobacteria bacterium]|nr:SIMPL domain-containing protein [Pseudomonadota bacterium]